MRVRRFILRFLGGLLLLLLAVAAALYITASWDPAAYRPAELGPEQQDDRLHEFVGHVADFNNQVGAGESFAWTLTAEQANAYLGSVDAIASLPLNRRIDAMARLEQAGFYQPAVAMEGGVLTLMVRHRSVDKVISADLAFAFTDEGLLTARIAAVRIGRLPVPRRLVDGKLAEARARLLEQLEAAERTRSASFAGIDLDRVARLLREVVAILDGEPVDPFIAWGAHRARIEGIDIGDGRLTLHVVSGSRLRPKETSSSRPAGGG